MEWKWYLGLLITVWTSAMISRYFTMRKMGKIIEEYGEAFRSLGQEPDVMITYKQHLRNLLFWFEEFKPIRILIENELKWFEGNNIANKDLREDIMDAAYEWRGH